MSGGRWGSWLSVIGLFILVAGVAIWSTSSSRGSALSIAQRSNPDVTAARTIPVAPAAAATPTTFAATSTAQGVLACDDAQLTVALGGANDAAGSRSLVLVFRNISGTPCSLYGYPGVAVLNEAGAQVLQATRSLTDVTGDGTRSGRINTVVLDPQESASAGVWESDVATESPCPDYPAILVTPPGDSGARKINISVTPCSNTIGVTPVVPGISGSTLFVSPEVSPSQLLVGPGQPSW